MAGRPEASTSRGARGCHRAREGVALELSPPSPKSGVWRRRALTVAGGGKPAESQAQPTEASFPFYISKLFTVRREAEKAECLGEAVGPSGHWGENQNLSPELASACKCPPSSRGLQRCSVGATARLTPGVPETQVHLPTRLVAMEEAPWA